MNNSLTKTLLVALSVSLVCAIIISTAAVLLKPQQQANIERDRQQNILAAAGLLKTDQPIEQQFAKVQPIVIDLNTGKVLNDQDANTLNPAKDAKDLTDTLSRSLTDLGIEDIAKIQRRENRSIIYLVRDKGAISKIILPIRGYGLWSTLYGFLALENDANTIAGIGFYQHGETPGLGGEIDNPQWKAQWIGKKLFTDNTLRLRVIKGRVPPASPEAAYQIDGLAGATLTTKGVHNLIQFWLSENGFQPFLQRLSQGEIQ